MPDRDLPPDSAFDLRARAELALAFEAGEPPATLLRPVPPLWSRRGFQRGLFAGLLAAGGVGTVAAMRPPALVRGAIEHEYFERTLRGAFTDPAALMERMGQGAGVAIPGFPQLLRPCEIEGLLAWHLTTFFEKGGMVTVFAFERPVALADGGGWWDRVHWRVVRARDARPLVLVAQKERALAVAEAALRAAPPRTG
jgi:hypothetical protein